MENKKLSFEYEGTRYTLSFNKRTVRLLSQNGFKTEMIQEQPAIGIPMLFKGAFLAENHWVKDDVKDKIYNSLVNKSELINKLLEMYIDPINALFDEPEDDAKKVTWEVNF